MIQFERSTGIILIVVSFILAFVISLMATPLSKKLAFKTGAVSIPNERSIHTKPMPLAGGSAIVIAFMITIVLVDLFSKSMSTGHYIAFIGGGLLITLVGYMDDIYNLNAKIKLFFQILAALIVVSSGITIEVLTWPFVLGGVVQLGPSINNIATVIWIVGIINALNLIDGLDGLATGIASIASICLMLIAIIYGNPMAILLTAALAGACLGFLPHNFNPASIFMGDTGSTFLGFTLAVISIEGLIKSYTAITLVIPIIILGLPIFDTSFAIIRRLATGKPVMKADRGHLHHRLVDKGYSHIRAVILLYAVASGFGIAGILFALNDILLAIVIIALILIFWLVDYLLTDKRMAKKEALLKSNETIEDNDLNEGDRDGY